MSSTAEKTKPGARRSNLQRLEDALEQRRQKIEAAEAEIAELDGREDQAAAESLRADPLRSAFAVRSPAHELRRKKIETERSLENLKREVLLLEGELGAARAELAAAELAARTKEAKRLGARELELRRQAGESFAALAGIWNELAGCLGERSALRAQVVAEHLRERVGVFDRAALEAWEEAAAYVIEPVPTSLSTFVDEVLAATTGPRFSDTDPDVLRGLNRTRAALGLAQEVRTESPTAKALCELYPDLREGLGVAAVGGVEVRRRQGDAVDGRFGGSEGRRPE